MTSVFLCSTGNNNITMCATQRILQTIDQTEFAVLNHFELCPFNARCLCRQLHNVPYTYSAHVQCTCTVHMYNQFPIPKFALKGSARQESIVRTAGNWCICYYRNWVDKWVTNISVNRRQSDRQTISGTLSVKGQIPLYSESQYLVTKST